MVSKHNALSRRLLCRREPWGGPLTRLIRSRVTRNRWIQRFECRLGREQLRAGRRLQLHL